MSAYHCKICASVLTPAQEAFFALPNITSDCRPWAAGRSVARCEACGLLQRVLLPQAVKQFETVYAGYEMFSHASAATDQLHFSADGAALGRTAKILAFVADKLGGNVGSVLDIGSGSGAGLVALGEQFPHADVHGFEPNDKPAERQNGLPENVTVVTKRPAGKHQYDLVTLFHVLEHVEDVDGLMGFIISALAPGGKLLIQVPYPLCTPFDFVIADHVWHFSKYSLAKLLARAGFAIRYLGNDLIKKELTLLAVAGDAKPVAAAENEAALEDEALGWLLHYKAFLDGLRGEMAVYGTGPAGAWTGVVLKDGVAAYVDDDPARQHAMFNGRPVVTAGDISASMPVVAAFPDFQAQMIAQKNKGLNMVVCPAKAA